MNNRILITGALGQLGEFFINSLVEAGNYVLATDIKKVNNISCDFEVYDILDIKRGDELVKKHNINQIYNFAAILSAKGENNPMSTWDLNNSGFMNIINICIDNDIKIFLSDPRGSSLYNYVKNGELKSEGGSITEGIGSSRITANFKDAKIDDAYSIDDKESLPILYDLIQNEGLSLGTSCGVNIAGAIRMGKELGPGKTIVTILCDRSDKYATKMFNKKFLEEKGLPVPNWF